LADVATGRFDRRRSVRHRNGSAGSPARRSAAPQPTGTVLPSLREDGRFADLNDVVEHYSRVLRLSLTEAERTELVQFLKSL